MTIADLSKSVIEATVEARRLLIDREATLPNGRIGKITDVQPNGKHGFECFVMVYKVHAINRVTKERLFLTGEHGRGVYWALDHLKIDGLDKNRFTSSKLECFFPVCPTPDNCKMGCQNQRPRT